MRTAKEELMNDPYVIQLLEQLGKNQEYIEELEDEIVNLKELAKDSYCRMQTEIERQRERILFLDERSIEDEKRLRAVYEAAVAVNNTCQIESCKSPVGDEPLKLEQAIAAAQEGGMSE